MENGSSIVGNRNDIKIQKPRTSNINAEITKNVTRNLLSNED